MKLTPSSFSISAASAREDRSDAPPAAACTTKVRSPVGNPSWAKAVVDSAVAMSAAPERVPISPSIFITLSRWVGGPGLFLKVFVSALGPSPLERLLPDRDHAFTRPVEVAGQFGLHRNGIAFGDQVEQIAVLGRAGVEILVKKNGETQQRHHDFLVLLPHIGQPAMA